MLSSGFSDDSGRWEMNEDSDKKSKSVKRRKLSLNQKPAEEESRDKNPPTESASPEKKEAEPDIVRQASMSVPVDFFMEESSRTGTASDIEMAKRAIEQEKRELKERRRAQLREEKARKREESKASRVKHPIGAKLILITSLLVIVALGGVTLLVSYFITNDVRMSAEENNFAINERTASDCENRILNATSSAELFLDLISTADGDEYRLGGIEAMFFERNKSLAAVFVPERNKVFSNRTFLISHEIEKTAVESFFAQESDSVEKAGRGAFELINATPFFGVPMIAIACRLKSGEDNPVTCILTSAEEITETFSNGHINQSCFVNSAGEILVHGDADMARRGEEISGNPVVRKMSESLMNNGQMTFRDENGEEYIAAFKRMSFGNGGVITTVKMSVVLEGINGTTRRNFYIMLGVLSIAITIIYFFSRSLSVPLKALTAVVNEINRGNFNTELFNSLKTNGKDEIGVLVKSTKNEREILDLFSRLTNKGVTSAVITKQIDFEPHLKDVTIFFSDIRGFTAISDGFKKRFGEKSAAEIIGFLNDYMGRMVTCIKNTGGVVDKFEGDAIMACWGVLRNEADDIESGLPRGKISVTALMNREMHKMHVREDALSAITSCIAMRYSLRKYNKDARLFTEAHKNEPLAQYKPEIRIGAGLNSGRVTVGFMGSFDKMEFTSIGDAVNLASRTEASNKPCGTDILITEDTLALLGDYIRSEANGFEIADECKKDEIIVEQIPVEFEVKGKGKQHFYGVVNMPNFDVTDFFRRGDPSFEADADCMNVVGKDGPKNLHELRVLLGIPEPEFEKVNLDAEENKIQPSAQ